MTSQDSLSFREIYRETYLQASFAGSRADVFSYGHPNGKRSAAGTG
jgi:hypothetical protein